MDRLQLLVFSYYREDPLVKKQLQPILFCPMSRSWSSIRVKCPDIDLFEKIIDLLPYLLSPLVSLGLGTDLVVEVPGSLKRTFSMNVPFHIDLLG